MMFSCSLLIIVFAIKPLMLWSEPSAFLTLDFSLRSSQVWGWIHLQREAALLVHCLRIVILFPSRGSGQAGKRAMVSQERRGDWLFHQAASHFELALDVVGLSGSHSIDSYCLCFIYDLIY